MGVTVPARGLSGCVNSQKPRGSLGEVCVRDLSNESQQNPAEPGTQESRSPGQREDPSQITCCQDVLLFAPAQRPGPQESSQAECVGSLSTLAQGPPRRPLALCPKEQEGNTGAPGRAWPPLPSHPGNPEFFPCGCGRGFWGCAGLQQAQADVGSEACGLVVSIPQERAGWVEGESPGSAGCPG